MGVHNFVLISWFFSSYAVRGAMGASVSFCTLCKNCYKMQTCNSIASIFGTNEERVTVDPRTKFVVKLRNFQGVMSVNSRKKRSHFCHGYRVNRVQKYLENRCVDRLIIVAVPFDSLNSNRVTATKL